MSNHTPESKFAPAMAEVIARQDALVDALCRAGLLTQEQFEADTRFHEKRLRDLAAKLGDTEQEAQAAVTASEFIVSERRRTR